MTPRRPAPVPAGTHDADLAAVYADPTPEGAARRQHDRDLTGCTEPCPWCDGGDVA